MEGLTLKEQAYLKIRKFILSGEIKPGTFLTERELTERLGMSRTPVRSALEKLEAEGIITNTPNKGPMVTEISINKALDIYDLRIALESHVIRGLSNFRFSDEDYNEIQNILIEQKKAVEDKHYIRFSELDAVFHKKIISLYRNEEIVKAFERIQNQITILALNFYETSSRNFTHFYEEHTKITELLFQNQTEECTKLIIEHLVNARSFYFSPNISY